MEEKLTLEREAEAVAAAKAARATHYDALHPFTYWRVKGHRVEVAVYDGGPLVWQDANRAYLPESCVVIR